MRFITLLLIATLLIAGCVPVTAPPSATSPLAMPSGESSTTLAFTNVRLFDGENVVPNATVIVQDGLIAEVSTDVEIPAGAEVIDGSGQTLLPGLIDAHTHVFSEDLLRQALIFGVTTELDMFMEQNLAAQLRQGQAETGALDRADLRSAGTLATVPGGHGTQFGIPIPTLTSADEAEQFVNERVAEGSDYIKIVIESGEEMGFSSPTLDQDTVTALAEAAKTQGKLSVVHVQTLAAAQEALNAGADGLAHIFTDAVPEQAFIERAAASGLFVIPTLTVFQHIGDDPSTPVDTSITQDPHLAPYLTTTDVQALSSPYSGFPALSLANGQEAVRLLFAAGVPILAGTDAGNPGTTHGASLHRELVLLTESGLSALDALRAATSVTAGTFGLSDRGRIAPGLRADLLLVNGDPTVEITATRDIVGVWKLGVRADRESYLATLEAQRTAASAQMQEFVAGDVVSIGDFETGTMSTTLGSGWAATTDRPAGGNSSAEVAVVEEGANETGYSLAVTGEVGSAVPFAWAGVSYSPSAIPFGPFDLSSKPTLHFWAKGEGGPFRVQLFCDNVGQTPPEQPIAMTPEWQEFTFDLAGFDGCNVAAVQAIIISAGTTPGAFSFQIDEVTLQ